MRNYFIIGLIVLGCLFIIATKSQSTTEFTYKLNNTESLNDSVFYTHKIHSSVGPITDRIIKRRKIVLD